MEEAETKVSSDEVELCESLRLADLLWPAMAVRSVSDLEVAVLGGSCGGSSRGVLIILLGSGEMSSTTGRRASSGAGGVDGRLPVLASGFGPVLGFRGATCDLARPLTGLSALEVVSPSVESLISLPNPDLGFSPEPPLAACEAPSGCLASLKVAVLTTTEGGGFGFVLGACLGSCSLSLGLLDLGGVGGPSFTGTPCTCRRGAGSRFLTGSTSATACFLPSNRDINDPVVWIDSLSGWCSRAARETTLLVSKLGRLAARECGFVADMGAWANPPPWPGVGLGEPDLLAAKVAAM